MILKKILFLSVSIWVASSSADEDKGALDLMLVSKMAGVCGVMQQMASFQSSTKMPGGTDFIYRFWTTESARLGKSKGQFMKECEQSIETYNQLWKVMEAMADK